MSILTGKSKQENEVLWRYYNASRAFESAMAHYRTAAYKGDAKIFAMEKEAELDAAIQAVEALQAEAKD